MQLSRGDAAEVTRAAAGLAAPEAAGDWLARGASRAEPPSRFPRPPRPRARAAKMASALEQFVNSVRQLSAQGDRRAGGGVAAPSARSPAGPPASARGKTGRKPPTPGPVSAALGPAGSPPAPSPTYPLGCGAAGSGLVAPITRFTAAVGSRLCTVAAVFLFKKNEISPENSTRGRAAPWPRLGSWSRRYLVGDQRDFCPKQSSIANCPSGVGEKVVQVVLDGSELGGGRKIQKGGCRWEVLSLQTGLL